MLQYRELAWCREASEDDSWYTWIAVIILRPLGPDLGNASHLSPPFYARIICVAGKETGYGQRGSSCAAGPTRPQPPILDPRPRPVKPHGKARAHNFTIRLFPSVMYPKLMHTLTSLPSRALYHHTAISMPRLPAHHRMLPATAPYAQYFHARHHLRSAEQAHTPVPAASQQQSMQQAVVQQKMHPSAVSHPALRSDTPKRASARGPLLTFFGLLFCIPPLSYFWWQHRQEHMRRKKEQMLAEIRARYQARG